MDHRISTFLWFPFLIRGPGSLSASVEDTGPSPEQLIRELQAAQREIEKTVLEKREVSEELGNVLLQLQETQLENEKLKIESMMEIKKNSKTKN